MQRLIDLLNLIEQKKNLYAPGMRPQWLTWLEEKQHYFLLHYKLEGEMDTSTWTSEDLIQAARQHEATRAKKIADYNQHIAQIEKEKEWGIAEADTFEPDPPFEYDDMFEVEWEEGDGT